MNTTCGDVGGVSGSVVARWSRRLLVVGILTACGEGAQNVHIERTASTEATPALPASTSTPSEWSGDYVTEGYLADELPEVADAGSVDAGTPDAGPTKPGKGKAKGWDKKGGKK
jgi:hypothetical protein